MAANDLTGRILQTNQLATASPAQPILGSPNVAQLPPVTTPTTYANPAVINPQATQAPPTGLIGAEQAMNQGQFGAEQLLLGGSNLGTQANNFQGAISGLGGVDAQNQAYATLGNSPATRYQMDQMQRATERSAAARGGLLGGNTLRALQENAAGIASQDYQNQVNNASQVADRGAGFTGLLANMRSNLGMETGAARTNAGMAIAQNAQTTASNISNLLQQQGVQVSDRLNTQLNTIANLLHDSGMQDSVDASQLAQILANISSGQASKLQSGYQAIGDANAAKILGVNNAVQGGLTQAIQLGAFGKQTTTPTTTPNYGGSYTGQVNTGNIA